MSETASGEYHSCRAKQRNHLFAYSNDVDADLSADPSRNKYPGNDPRSGEDRFLEHQRL